MKTITIIIITAFLLMAFIGNSQSIDLQMRAGYGTKGKQGIISPAASFKAYGLALSPEMVINTADNAPVQFGTKISYQIGFMQVGYGRYYDLYTTDKYDADRNGWSSLLFASLHYKRFFLEYDWNAGASIISFGMKETIANFSK